MLTFTSELCGTWSLALKMMISVLLRFAVRCGIHVYNFGVKLRDRVGPVGVRQ